jgi:mannose-6-phosphate isomerase-like protein (cupin superfamily)
VTAQRVPRAISIDDALATLTFLPDRTPATGDHDAGSAFAMLSTYREGGVFVAHWAGRTEWERHPAGDEVVMVLDGETTISFLTGEGDATSPLRAGELVIVPQGTWHRFETPEGVKLLTVTPWPTDHSTSRPG